MTNTQLSVTKESAPGRQLVTMRIDGQLLCIGALEVREILSDQKIARIPLVPEQVAGVLNLRGRIVTVIDIRSRLRLPPRDKNAAANFVVVEHKGDLYSLIVDSVGDVLNLPAESVQGVPPNLPERWREIAEGVCRLEKDLLVIISLRSLFPERA